MSTSLHDTCSAHAVNAATPSCQLNASASNPCRCLSLQGIANEASCDAGLLHMVLSLDAVRSLAAGSNDDQQPAASASDSHAVAGDAAAGSVPAGASAANAVATGIGDGAAAGAQDFSGGGGAEAMTKHDGRVPLLRCGAADVDALQTHWERTPQPWRDSVAAGCR